MSQPNQGSFAGCCIECKRLLRQYQVAQQTPDGPWCTVCDERARYYSDPQNVAYEKARAAGWAD